MQKKETFIKNSLMILKTLYPKMDVIAGETILVNKTLLNTKFELKKYMRSIISSDNKNYKTDIVNVIHLRYAVSDDVLVTLNEIFPNLDIFIATYIKATNKNIKLPLIFDYEKLFVYLLRSYINKLNIVNNKKAYLDWTEKEKKLTIEVNELEEKLKYYQIIRKNRFYYETYLNSLEMDKENFEEEKVSLQNKIASVEKSISEYTKEYDRQIKWLKTKKRLNRLDEISLEISDLKNELEILNNELASFDKRREKNKAKNDASFLEFIKDSGLTIDEFKEYYEKLKRTNAKELLEKINKRKTELNNTVESLAKSTYPKEHLLLKYFCVDNLKLIDKKADMTPKVLKEIIMLLEENVD